MRTLSQRASSGLFWAAIAVVVAVLGMGAIGIVGVHSSGSAARAITRDQLATSTLTTQVARQIDAAHADGLAVLLQPDAQLRGYLAQQLYTRDLPAAESGVGTLIAMHAGDDKAELADVNRFVASWSVLRDDLITARAAATTRTQPALVTPFEMAAKPLNANLDTLFARESQAARAAQGSATNNAEVYTYLLVGLLIAVVIGGLIVAYLAWTRVRDAMKPAQEQIEFADTLRRMFAQASRSLEPLALMRVELDHVDELNDRFGQPVGDHALAMVGTAIRSALRDSDFAGRTGGDEFVVLLPGTAVEGAASAADKIRAAIAHIELPNGPDRLTASLGLAVYPDHAVSAQRLELLADAALDAARGSGGDQTVITTEPTLHDDALDVVKSSRTVKPSLEVPK
jgi:diguanylate cyclase (GGDEF)-like protein